MALSDRGWRAASPQVSDVTGTCGPGTACRQPLREGGWRRRPAIRWPQARWGTHTSQAPARHRGHRNIFRARMPPRRVISQASPDTEAMTWGKGARKRTGADAVGDCPCFHPPRRVRAHGHMTDSAGLRRSQLSEYAQVRSHMAASEPMVCQTAALAGKLRVWRVLDRRLVFLPTGAGFAYAALTWEKNLPDRLRLHVRASGAGDHGIDDHPCVTSRSPCPAPTRSGCRDRSSHVRSPMPGGR